MQKDDWTVANLDDKDRALLAFARKLNNTPRKMRPEDIHRLRAAGFTGRNIFDVVLLVAFFNYMNRIPESFEMELDPERQESYERHLQDVIAAERPKRARVT